MKYFTKEVQIALVAIVGIVVLFFGLKFLKGVSLVSNETPYYATFDNVSGLSSSSPVYVDGFKVGSVGDVKFDYSYDANSVVTLNIDKQFRLAVGTTANIESDLMGNVKVVLTLPDNPNQALAPGDTIFGDQAHGALSKAAGMLPQVEAMLPKLDSILASLNAILGDPAIRNVLHNADKISSDLTTTTTQLNKLMAEVNGKVPSLLTKADATMANAEKLTKNLSDVDVAYTMEQVNSTLKSVHEMADKLNSKEGTLGLLINDPTLYNNLTATMGHADSLVIDLKAHPKRYVHFSVFGKKDK